MLEERQSAPEVVQKLFEEWRQNKKHREKIPQALWEAAASLSGKHSAHQISKLLHLNHTAVRDRILEYRKNNGLQKPKENTFVEVGLISQPTASECTVELERPGGAKIRISFKGRCPDIAGLSKAFLG
jgi:hypothetical protein